MDYKSVLVGIALAAIVALVYRFLLRGPREPVVEVICGVQHPHGLTSCELRSRHTEHQGWSASATRVLTWPAVILLTLWGTCQVRANDGPEPFDGPECADLLGRYVTCPGAKPSPAPAVAATPAPVRIVEPVVTPIDAETKDEAPPVDRQRPASFEVAAGGLASVGGGADTAVDPGISLLFDAPLYEQKDGKATRLEVDARLGVLQGQALGLAENTAFRAISVAGRLCQPLAVKLYFMPCIEAGFATRLAGDQAPRHTSARWLSFQIKAANARGDFLSVGVGPDERLDDGESGRTDAGPYYQPAAQVGGSVRLWAPENTAVELRLVMQAVLFLRTGYGGRDRAPADRVTVGILVAR
jgi:hypothetical protein